MKVVFYRHVFFIIIYKLFTADKTGEMCFKICQGAVVGVLNNGALKQKQKVNFTPK